VRRLVLEREFTGFSQAAAALAGVNNEFRAPVGAAKSRKTIQYVST
jgi:hypothetical protein